MERPPAGHQPVEPGVRLGRRSWRPPVKADELGYDHVWTWDHVQAIFGDPDQPIFEGYTALAAVAQATKRARLGLFVGANTFRNPGLAAKSVATIDHISGGRAILGLGGAWFGHEHQSFGFDFGVRVRAAPRLAGRGGAGDPRPARRRRGHSAPAGATRSRPALLPRPVQAHVPVMIGGGGERKTLRIVAQYADMWNVFGTPETVAHKDEILRAHCAEVGRDSADDRAHARLQDHDPLDRGRGGARPAAARSSTTGRRCRGSRATSRSGPGRRSRSPRR